MKTLARSWVQTLVMMVILAVFPWSATQAGPANAQQPGTQQQGPQQQGPQQQAPSTPKSFLPPRPGAPGATSPVAEPPTGVLGRFYFWVAQQQQRFLKTLAESLRDIKAGNTFAAALVLISFSFAYGVLHAAGPGHGKAIVSSYMLADGQSVRRGVQLAFLSSVVQAFSAIALFSIVVLMLRGARTQIVATEMWLERASWALVALFGLWLLVRQLRSLFRGGLFSGQSDHAHANHGHDHGHAHAAGNAHDHDRGHDHKEGAHKSATCTHAAHNHGTHNHGHDHGHDHHGHDHHGHDHHGHVHLPGPEAVVGPWSWRRAATLAFAVGIRPCTGAIGVLFVANGLGLLWAGVVSTFVMALGTAMTVSGLAALAASSRDVATRLAGTADNRWAARAQTAIGLIGALLVFILGASFFYYSLTTSAPV